MKHPLTNMGPRHALAGTLLLAVHGLTLSQMAQNTTYRYQYDANGNLTQITDPLGRVTDQSYDALNRLTQQLQPAPVAGAARPTIKYGYDARDRLVSVTDPRNLVTTYTFNGLGDQIALASPDTGATGNTYDAAGNLKTSTDARGKTTIYAYDVLNRITRVTFADDNAIDYTYDQGQNGIGRLTGFTDVSGSTRYAYDQKGRVLSETRTINTTPYVTSYGYDNVGRLASVTYPSGRVVTYTRDSAGRIGQIDVSKGGVTQTIISQVQYQPFGGVQTFVNGAGQAVTRSFDLDGRITSYTLRAQAQLINYDAASRIKFIADTAAQGVTSNYGYDDLDRLTQYNGADASKGYKYDAVGNRTGQTVGSGIYTYTYSPTANRLTQLDAPAGSQSYSYEANGSITGNGNSQFNYDARGRMVSAMTPIGLVQYRINALGQRVQKTTPTETVVYHYDLTGKLIAESDGISAKDYIYLGDIPVAVLTQ